MDYIDDINYLCQRGLKKKYIAQQMGISASQLSMFIKKKRNVQQKCLRDLKNLAAQYRIIEHNRGLMLSAKF